MKSDDKPKYKHHDDGKVTLVNADRMPSYGDAPVSQPAAQEPVAWMHTLAQGEFGDTGWNVQFLRDQKEADSEKATHGGVVTPLYTAPPQPVQAELSDAEIVEVLASLGIDAEKSKYGFDALQVRTTVPRIRDIVKGILAAAKK